MSRSRLARWGRAGLLALAAIYSVFPIYFITVQSLKTDQEDVFGHPLWVANPRFENYTELFEGAGAKEHGFVIVLTVPFLLWLMNSGVVLASSLIVTLLVAVPAAYALGRLQPPGWRWWRRALFASYVIPHTILFIPLYSPWVWTTTTAR